MRAMLPNETMGNEHTHAHLLPETLLPLNNWLNYDAGTATIDINTYYDILHGDDSVCMTACGSA